MESGTDPLSSDLPSRQSGQRSQGQWFNHGARRLLILLGLLAIVLVSFPLSAQIKQVAQAPPRTEIRGVWMTNVDSDVLFNPDRLRQGVQELARLNFNTLYPVVWNWGYTTYPSAILRTAISAPVDPRPDNLVGRDSLAELVEVGHQHKMAVIPWFEFGFMVPEDSAMALRHPDWLTQKRNGDQTWQEGKYPRVWLNPFLPEVQQFVRGLILEIVTNYQVDGIQFDDHFGLPVEFGYDAYTVQLYQREHGGKAPPANPNDPEWMRWRANKITGFLSQIFRDIKSRNTQLIVGLSPNNYDFAYNHSLQDWRLWERNGLIEELVLQVYQNNLSSFNRQLAAPEIQDSRRHIPTGIGILTGLKPKPVPMRQIQEQVQAVRRQNFAGVSFFFYESLWKLTQESADSRKAGFQSVFPTPAPRPDIS
ncbi:MAG: glycoside hydrolase family 10 protein [Leptolyngbyaceae cyanobacterium]